MPQNPFLLSCCIKKRNNQASQVDDEVEHVQYSYSVMHLIYASATLYMMMTLTNWYEENGIEYYGLFFVHLATW